MPVYFKVVCDTCGDDFDRFVWRDQDIPGLIEHLSEINWAFHVSGTLGGVDLDSKGRAIDSTRTAPHFQALKVWCPKHAGDRYEETNEEPEGEE